MPVRPRHARSRRVGARRLRSRGLSSRRLRARRPLATLALLLATVLLSCGSGDEAALERLEATLPADGDTAPAPLTAAPLPAEPTAPVAGRLVVFVGQGDAASEAERAFLARDLPALRATAEELGVAVSLRDVADGAPPEVGLVPLLVFQNHRGRSVYQGRTTTPGRVRNFLRTARHVPPAGDGLTRTALPVWRLGRAHVVSPLKITGLGGTVPEGFDPEAFTSEARAALVSGMSRFEARDVFVQGPSDRAFYMDVHPWRSEGGELYLSLAVFSGFHCKEPVFTSEDPVSGDWDDRAAVFARAGRRLEQAVAAALADEVTGDGFRPLAATTPLRPWDHLGLPLPEAPTGSPVDATGVVLPDGWRLAPPGPLDPPRLVFHLAAPLDSYAGEARELDARLTLPARDAAPSASRPLDGATGWVEVPVPALTMGEPDLDEALQGSIFLASDRWPTARFELDTLEADGPLTFGHLTPAQAAGRFTMKGLTIPLDVVCDFEPVVTADGAPRLLASGRFTIRLREPFGITTLDEPAPANDTMEFEFAFALEPAD